ncbi:MerR family DNA-binding protein [Erwiniaceae bacterium CAU 1747]
MLHHQALIVPGQAGGLSLDEINGMLSPGGAPQVDRALLLARADEIDATVRRLRAMSQGLRHVAKCPSISHAECPEFQH